MNLPTLNDLLGGTATRPTPTRSPAQIAAHADLFTQPIPSGYGAAALRAEARNVAWAVEGTRNHQLNVSAMNLYQLADQGILDHQTVTDTLTDAAYQAGLDSHETAGTLASARRGAARKPREPVDLRPAFNSTDPRLTAPTTPDHAGTVNGHATLTPEQAEQARADRRARAVHAELEQLRIRHEARTQHDAELAAASFRVPPSRPTLVEELAMPEEPVQYGIDQLLPLGGNALLTAGFKTGKTTVVGDYVKAWCDGRPFLGKHAVNSTATGRVAIFNYELSPEQYRGWLRSLNLRHPERAVVLHLRGFRLPVIARTVEDWTVAWLAEHDVHSWIVDPFARAFTGCGDENDNTAVGTFLDTLDVIKERAGVRDMILPVHTGRAEQEAGAERARGATRLDDWADVRWLLTKDEAEHRYFRATGRDVDTQEELLRYDEQTRTLELGGGDRAWVKRRDVQQAVMEYVTSNPGCTSAEVEAGVTGRRDSIRQALAGAIASHDLRVEHGAKNARQHYPNSSFQ